MSLTPEVIWFLAGLALILVEFMLPGIILVFFGAGAWIVALTTWSGLTPGIASQSLVFAGSSLVLLILLRRRIRGRFFGHVSGDQDPNVNIDAFAGQTVVVLEAIGPDTPGRVEFKGAGWTAVADIALAVGQRATIVAADGLTLRVAPLKSGNVTAGPSGEVTP